MPRSKIKIYAVILTFAAVVVLLIPVYTRATFKGECSRSLSRLRFIHMATYQMADDGREKEDHRRGWPGDLESGPHAVYTVSTFLRRLMEFEYLHERDLKYITSAPRIPGWSPAHPDANANCAFKVYRVKERDSHNTIAFASRNFTYGESLKAHEYPGKEAFIVMHKAGDGAVCVGDQAMNLQILGLLPGRKDITDRPLETAEDTLVQK
jgi:hypothetical protein